jgi:cobalt transporter subunit CbtB
MTESPKSQVLARATGLALPADLPHIVAAALLGAFIVLGVGFAPMAAVHNAAHDARHSFAFPCH